MKAMLTRTCAYKLERSMIERCRSGSLQSDEALTLFDRLFLSENHQPSIKPINSLLTAITKTKYPHRYSTVISLFDRLCQLQEGGVCPDIQTFGVVLNCFCCMGRVDLGSVCLASRFGSCAGQQIQDAAKVFAKMPLMGCAPDLIFYNTLIDGLCRTGYARYGH